MFYQNLPLYLKLIDILKKEYSIIHNLPKEYKFSLGQDITNRTWTIIDLYIIAQTCQNINKIETVKQISQEFECLKLRVRFLSELKLISIAQSASLADDLIQIGKMVGSWLKNV